jgi:hypothetical protein
MELFLNLHNIRETLDFDPLLENYSSITSKKRNTSKESMDQRSGPPLFNLDGNLQNQMMYETDSNHSGSSGSSDPVDRYATPIGNYHHHVENQHNTEFAMRLKTKSKESSNSLSEGEHTMANDNFIE